MSMTGSVPFKLYRPLALGASGSGVNVEVLAASRSLTYFDEQFQSLDPGGAGRDLILPVPDADHRGCFFVIFNAADAAEDLTVKNAALTILAVISKGESITFASTSSAWKVLVAATTTTPAIADPGNGAAIPVTASGSLGIITAGAETNTLADPTFIGQWLTIYCDVHVGDRVVTAASRVNQAGNTILTFGAVGDFIKLEAITVGGLPVWQVVSNDGVVLS